MPAAAFWSFYSNLEWNEFIIPIHPGYTSPTIETPWLLSPSGF
jgi:hypothetical protein